IRELSALYTAFLAGQPDPLPPLAIQYPDYAAWQRQWLLAERTQLQSDYWRAILADAPVLLDLPTDRPRPLEQSFVGHAVPVNLDPALTTALKRLSEQHGVTLFMTLLSAWAVVLSRLSGQDDVVIGTPSAGRSRQEVESLIGFFVNTLALRVDLSGELTVTELLARVRQTALAAQEHQDLPFEQVVEIVQPPRRLAHTPLFQVMFAWQNNESTAWQLPGLAVSPVDQVSDIDIVKFDLELNLSEEEGRIVGALSYATALFDHSTIERQVGYLHAVLQEMVAHAQQRIGEIDILAQAERRLLLETWNAPETIYPDQLCIHQLFEQQVEKNPDAIALVHEEQTFSYAELNARANRLAHQLIALGVVPDQRVAICVSRSPAMVVAVLAVLKAGGAYVPLDPVYTGERLTHILTDAAPAILLADKAGRAALDEKTLAALTVLDPNTLPEQPDSNPQVPALNARHLAYVIYTSGSTGTPKGVMVEHRNIQRLFEATESWYHFNRQDIWCLLHSIAFDFSVWELWGALRYGAKLVLVPHAIARSPQELHQFVCQHGITVLNQTPSAFKAFIASYVDNPLPDQLRYIIFGGEALDPGMLRPWYRLREETSPRLVNMYGITETTVHVTYRELSPHDVAQITSPIGTRIPDLTLYLLDKYGQPVPLGTIGELYVGGAGVARGYLNRPELTAERFLVDPFSDKPDARMYRTGDLARYLPEGDLVFVGRNDQQVKIRGFRIEPGEIEARLIEHPSVRESAVLALGDAQDKRLVAYVVAPEDEGLANSLRTHLSTTLPDYMVPTAFVRLDALPLTPNGKLDHRALPAPDNEAFARQVYEAPQGDTEITLAAIWCELLGVEQVSRHDNFFALGGHSLLAVRMIERLRHLGLMLAVRNLFQSPVLSDLAQTLGQHRAVVVPPNVITSATTTLTPEMLPLIDLTQADIDRIVRQVPGGMTHIQDIYALSPLQDGILFHHLLANEGDPYLVVSQMAFADRSLLDRYLAAVQQVIDRHDILRTAFIWQGLSVPAQVVWRQATLSVMELTLDPTDSPVCDQLMQRFDPRHYRLDLNQAPLLQFVVAQERDGRWIVLQLLHHLIGDHTTLDVMNREVQAYLDGQQDSLSEPVPFRHLVAQGRLGVSQEEHTRFFTDMLAAVDEPTLPFGLTEVHRDGSQVAESHRMLSAGLNNRLRHQARHLGVSLAALCHLAWAQVLSRTSGQEQVVFGTVLFGRMQAGEGTDSSMGLFINTLPLRLDMDDTPVRDSVQAAHTRLAGLLEHEHASLALAQRCSGVQGEIPLFSSLLNYRHNALSAQSDELISGIEFIGAQERTNYPLVLSVEDCGESLGLTVQVVQPFDPKNLCDYMQQALESLVEVLEQAPKTPVRQLEILPEAERTLLLKTWNVTETASPDQSCIHQLFEQQVAKAPDAPALVYEDQLFSYAELNARANRLAHQLIALGVVPEQRVAICVSRSPAMVVAVLAVLKAGGAYVPLDPVYTGERLAHILTDAAPAILLADNPGRDALNEQTLAALTVLDPNNTLPDQPDVNPRVPALTSRQLAYVIYTSGSTGMPKGVMVEHRNIQRLFEATESWYHFNRQDIWCLLHSIAFDFSVWELWGALRYGAKLVLVPHAIARSPQELHQFVCQHGITVLNQTPSAFKAFIASYVDNPLPDQLRYIIFGGEALDPGMLRPWYRLREETSPRLVNMYGITETTVHVTYRELSPHDVAQITSPIGTRIPDLTLYLLDKYGQPVPLGTIGELYVGGAGVARGYLNRPELTVERFLVDPFSDNPDARMYRTGDLARYLPDGNLEFLGRNDQQVKIRGFRIEPGEIEARLIEHPSVRESVVLALGEAQDKRLVAYVVAPVDEGLANSLRTHLSATLPDYMVPSAFVRLDALPLTPNGKLDRRALPAPDGEAVARQVYAAPQGETEIALSVIWRELLGVEQVSRHDSFFALGGHSLLAVRMIERLRNRGLTLAVRDLFQSPVLSELARTLGQHQAVVVPPNVITSATTTLTPVMLPLIDLTQADIDRIVGQVPGGVANLQDIYALSPLQDGILFHHLLANEGDPYLVISQMAFADRPLLDRYLAAVQQMVDRHDILRTAFIWQGLSVPAQVVWRQAPLSVTELTLDPADGPVGDQLVQRFNPRHYRIDLGQAPLLRFVVVQETDGRWFLLELLHHLIGDHTTLDVMNREVQAYLTDQEDGLPAPVPFRNLVAQARLGISQEEHTRFFTNMLAEVDEPTLPFGLANVHHDGSQERESYRMLTTGLNDRLRYQARHLGVSLAALCHLAWAQVLSHTSGQEKVVFGTVLFGRMAAGEGADNGMGLFINTLPLRLDIDDTPVRDSVRAAHLRLAGLLAHEHASLALAQRCSGVASGTPLFSALLNYRHNDQQDPLNETMDGIEFLGGQESTNYPFGLSVEDGGSTLGLTANAVQPFDPDRICGYMQQALESLVEALEQAPETSVRALNILPETERTLLLETWNATETAYPDALCIHQLFEQQVKLAPEATALAYQEQTLSYAELNACANRLAHQLIAQGVTPDQRVAICVERSPAMVVALLAVLKAGGAYVPLDLTYPGERLAYILNDTAPAVVLADAAGKVALGEAALAGLTVLDPNTRPDQPDSNPQVTALTPQHLAYVIYTSGSTGQPKGVMVEHQAIYQRYLGFNDTYSVTAQDRLLQFSAFAFDVSVEDFFSSLCNGATLVLRDDSWLASMPEFIALTQQYRITVVSLPTLFWSELAARDTELPLPDCLRLIIIGGEAVKKNAIQDWFRQEGHRPRLLNGYGPTENVVTVTYKDVLSPADAHSIGRPAKNARIYLLDQYGQPVPLGCVGEMYIGGVGVARGYLNQPELSAERFIPDPFSPIAGARMYRTGDLARYLLDSDLEFLGRNDEQVKIRGFRIELGEIEVRLAEHPAVSESVVLAQGEGPDKRLVAYVVASADEGLANRLREHLSVQLPDYMVPSAFVRLDAFPLTPNGKLDRRALPAPDEEAFARQVYAAPQGETEIALAAIWCEILGIEQISRHDNFFALGGHSLLAVRVMNRMAAFDVELPLTKLFKSPSLAAFAEEIITTRLDKQDRALSAILPISREGELPLSFAQQRLWFLAQLDGVSETYHIPIALSLRGSLDIVAWQQALNALFARHEALRSVFVSIEGQPQVRLLAPDGGLLLSQHDLRGFPDAQDVLECLCAEEACASFDLDRGPLIRASLIRLTDDEYGFLLTQHHIISDGWSVDVLIGELSALYTAFLAGQPDPLPPLAIQYPDYAAWQRQWLSAERVQIQSDYWRTLLADAPVLLDLPTDRPRPSEQSFAGNAVLVNLDPALTTALKRLSEQHGVTLFMTLLSAWTVVLSRLSGQNDVVIGTPSAGRSRQEVEPLIGCFVNTLALRMDVSGDLTVTELLARVRQTALAAQEHQDLPFERVVEIVQPPRRLAHTPLFQVMFAWQNNESTAWQLPGLAVSPVDQAVDIIKFDLELGLSEEEGRIVGALSYATALFDQSTMERQVGYLHTVLQAMVAHAQQRIGEIDILAPAERKLLLETWNATETPYPEALCLHQLFEQQVERTPQATALVYEEQILSYAELNARANRLAHQLIALGVEPDQRVAICVSRSPAMVVALLAVMKSGGAYVPLDPTYPLERLAYILNDTTPSVALADAAGRVALGDKVLGGLTVLDPNTLPDQSDRNPQVPALTPQHLVYVIYTSGSTGQPKGVMVEHQAVYQRHLGFNETYAVTAQDRMLQFASFAFDVSVEECFSTLCNGATLVMRDDRWLASMSEFIALAWQNRITVMSLPALFWSELIVRDNSALPLPDCLRLIIIGGDAVKKSAIQDWFAREIHRPRLLNAYGPTENTVTATCQDILSPADDSSIGRPLKNTCVYLLDRYGQPVPLGCIGEMYIGGVGVARGYLNQPELSAERFIPDPFSPVFGARMYRTGDLARYLPDGDLEFLGRNDQQVKIRGFRVELGEIETRLMEHSAVQEAAVLVLDDGQGKRLVAYVIAEAQAGLAARLREHLSVVLPDYMIPAAFVRLDTFPQTPNGKLDRRALPAPGEEAFARQVYEAPQGKMETMLAAVWCELLGVEQISRYDSFFALGGHSLLAVRMIDRLRRIGLSVSVKTLFQYPTLCILAQSLVQHDEIQVPDNHITRDTTVLTPEMLPLIDLTQADIDRIVKQVPGGMGNIQDIYALSPLQDGILFHHLLANEGDPYLLVGQMAFADRDLLDRYLTAVQRVVDRHDILRTAFIWQELSVPAQVVWRQAQLSVTELTLNPADGPVSDQLTRRFDPRRHRLDLNQAPLLRFVIAQETDGRWIVLELQHHLIGDHETMEVMHREVQAYLTGQEDNLPAPTPFRNLVAQAELGVSQEEHTRFFTDMLATVDEPTLPFGLTEVHRDGSQVTEVHRMLPAGLNNRLRHQARHLSVSLAALCHLAWAQVLSRTSDQQKVVFGTVLFGRMQAGEGADNSMGLFINTLPLRLDIDETSVRDSVQAAHTRLAGLLEHEHASLALAQRCSGVRGDIPLFNSLLNYRHNTLPATSDDIISSIEFLGAQERTNYPLMLSVEDFGGSLGLTAQVVQPFDPASLCGYMQQALESLVEALEQAPETPVRALNILPEAERMLLLKTWNATETPYPDALCIHQLFEQQVEKNPNAIALVYEEQTLSYAELNARANRLAHQLIALGVEPDQRVAICVSRSPAMVVGLLAVMKAGGAYVPLDPVYPGERLAHILTDAAPAMVLADEAGRAGLGEETLAALTVLDPNTLPDQPDSNPQVPALTARHLAYVIYTSGSTGTPKGVMIEHRNTVNFLYWAQQAFGAEEIRETLFSTSMNFDLSIFECFMPLSCGAAIHLVEDVLSLMRHPRPVSLINSVPSAMKPLLQAQALMASVHTVNLAGEPLKRALIEQIFAETPVQRLCNLYGPSETTTYSAWISIPRGDRVIESIGRPIANTGLYLLDGYGQPVPLGVVGEIYIAGAGVARGYFNRPDLTADRFLIDPFSENPDARMYRTGDLARYLPDGNLAFLGRNDQQVKIRGFRIEPGEIEARLVEHPAVSESAVLAQGEGQEKRLVAYVVAPADEGLVNSLHTYLSAILPDYMVPSAFVRLDAFPLTPNGKLDRQALPAADNEAVARQAYAAPQGETEIALAAIWREILGIEQISRHDNFFALGGHSLLAVRVMNRVAAFGVELSLATLFKSPTLRAFAEVMQARSGQPAPVLPAIVPIARESELPLSFAQQRLWFLAQLEGVSETYHIPMALRLRGQLDIMAW
ncbi:non-ribosomal peptide synthetase, partial [Photorhabdus khanii]